MDLARRLACPCHRTPEHHLANGTRLADLGVAARYRKEQEKRRSQPVVICLPTDHPSHLVPGEITRLYARDSFRGPTNGNVAYCGITPTLCRPIRLGGDGAVGRAGLRQHACE